MQTDVAARRESQVTPVSIIIQNGNAGRTNLAGRSVQAFDFYPAQPDASHAPHAWIGTKTDDLMSAELLIGDGEAGRLVLHPLRIAGED